MSTGIILVSEHIETVVVHWLGLGVPISYCSLPEELETKSDSQYQLSLDLFGSLNNAIGVGFAKLGYYPTTFRYQVLDFRKKVDCIAPQSVVFVCYSPDGQRERTAKSFAVDALKVYSGVDEMADQLSGFTRKSEEIKIELSDLNPMCFVVSSRASVSIDTVVDVTEKLFHASKDSLHHYQNIKEQIKMPVRDFLEQGINLESFPLYLDYKIKEQSTASMDKVFDMKVSPVKLTFKRTEFKQDSHQEETIFRKEYSSKDMSERVPDHLVEYIEELDSVTKEGLVKVGKMLGRDYQDLSTKLDICVFRTGGVKGGYVVHLGVHECHGLSTYSVKLTAVVDPTSNYTPNAYRGDLVKILEKVRKENTDEKAIAKFGDLIHAEMGMRRNE